MSQINNGLADVRLGAIGVDGAMGTTLKSVGNIKEGSFTISHEEGDKVEFKAEAFDEPIFIKRKKGLLSFEFEIHDPNVEALIAVFGGGKTSDGKYTPPASNAPMERSLKIVPESGFGFDVPRVSISARFSGAMGKDALLGVIVKADVMKPTKAGLANYEMPVY